MAIRGSVERAPRKAFYGDLVKGGFDEGIKPLTDMLDDKDDVEKTDEGECIDGVMVGGPDDGKPCEKIEQSDDDDGSTTSGTSGTSTSDTNGGASVGIKPDGTWETGEKYAMAKWGQDLNVMSTQRDELTPNSDEYNKIQNMINEALANKKRH